jgi:hypothetical protein
METENEGYYLEYVPSSNLELQFKFKHNTLANGGKCLVYEIPETFNLLSVSDKAKQMGLDL